MGGVDVLEVVTVFTIGGATWRVLDAVYYAVVHRFWPNRRRDELLAQVAQRVELTAADVGRLRQVVEDVRDDAAPAGRHAELLAELAAIRGGGR